MKCNFTKPDGLPSDSYDMVYIFAKDKIKGLSEKEIVGTATHIWTKIIEKTQREQFREDFNIHEKLNDTEYKVTLVTTTVKPPKSNPNYLTIGIIGKTTYISILKTGVTNNLEASTEIHTLSYEDAAERDLTNFRSYEGLFTISETGLKNTHKGSTQIYMDSLNLRGNYPTLNFTATLHTVGGERVYKIFASKITTAIGARKDIAKDSEEITPKETKDKENDCMS